MPDYTRGPTYAQSDRPTFEYKASSPGYTGGGYPRIRSTEYRDHTPGTEIEDVYVSVHRLAAVTWHLPDGTLGDDVHLSALDGHDVHHCQPGTDDRGMPAANGPEWTMLVDHGTHSEITQTDMRAWGEDAKRERDADADDERCTRCDAELDTACISPDWDGRACPECAKRLSDGAAIEVVS